MLSEIVVDSDEAGAELLVVLNGVNDGDMDDDTVELPPERATLLHQPTIAVLEMVEGEDEGVLVVTIAEAILVDGRDIASEYEPVEENALLVQSSHGFPPT